MTDVPRNEWPPAIASLHPEEVSASRDRVSIVTVPYLDGGWGYDVVHAKNALGLPFECYDELIQGVYWHGLC